MRQALVGALVILVAAVPAVVAGCGGEAEPAVTGVEDVAPDTGETDAGKAEKKKKKKKPKRTSVRVVRVIDGDTIEVSNGKTVRLVQIDAPEKAGECYGAAATAVLEALLPPGTRVGLERDRALDNVDRYGRVLRYVFRKGQNVNVVLVRRGAASVWFYDGDRGRYADRLLVAARKARAQERGAWGECDAELDPTQGFQTRPKGSSSQAAAAASVACVAGYDPCLPVGPDLDCADVRRLGRAPVEVMGSDPYDLDADGDGLACE